MRRRELVVVDWDQIGEPGIFGELSEPDDIGNLRFDLDDCPSTIRTWPERSGSEATKGPGSRADPGRATGMRSSNEWSYSTYRQSSSAPVGSSMSAKTS